MSASEKRKLFIRAIKDYLKVSFKHNRGYEDQATEIVDSLLPELLQATKNEIIVKVLRVNK